ncbi:MAG: DUF3199 family protein [Oscillospiraceae bacterium]
MASRPWVTPQEVKAYTEYPSVLKRDDAKIITDISRAEQYIISYVNTDFSDKALPGSVKTAVILVAEAYAFNACVAAKELKSETFDDYSYTTETRSIDVEALDIKPLLDDYTVVKSRSGVTMRMRKL